jgi:hypothetical protein
MGHQRYDMREKPDGSWSVIDVFTGQPATLDGILMVGFEIQEADDILDLINNKDVKERRAKGID